LEGLESRVAGKEQCQTGDLTIEHIMPQELSEAWIINLGADARAIHKELLHTLGNLTLTGYNPELSNGAFKSKLKHFITSNVALNKRIASEAEWGRLQIEQRASQLAALAVSIWQRPT